MDIEYNKLHYYKKMIVKILLYSFAILYTINSLFPLFFAFISSVKPDVEIYGKPFALPDPISFKSYMYAIETSHVLRGILNSLIYTTFSTALVLLLALFLGYFLSRFKVRFKEAISVYFLASLTLPIYACLIPLAVIINRFGLRNSVFGLVILYTAMNISYAFFIIYGYMKSIPKELDESAIIDGCGPIRLLFSIIVPLTMPAIVTTAIIIGKGVYNDLIFGALMVTKSELFTLSLSLLTLKTDVEVKVNVIYAAICLSILPVMLFFIVFQKRIEQGLTTGAIKG